MPYEKNFCAGCNRLRVSAKGKLHLCLFGEESIELRDLLQSDEQITQLQAPYSVRYRVNASITFYIKGIVECNHLAVSAVNFTGGWILYDRSYTY